MEGWAVALLTIIGVVVLGVVEYLSASGIYGWLDVRSARDADDVRRNIEEYGPEAPGLKLSLLPADERAAVLVAREQARQRDHHRGRRAAAH